jgi:hypothetical protein
MASGLNSTIEVISLKLKGWMIGDDTANHTIASSVSIPPLGYVVLGNRGNVFTNGGVNVTYAYGNTLQLSNSADFPTAYLTISLLTILVLALRMVVVAFPLPYATLP